MDADDKALMLTMSADIRGLQKQLAKAGQLAKTEATTIQRRFDGIKLGGGNGMTKAFQNDLAGLRSHLLSTAAGGTGLTGVLGSLGPAGLGAAAGVVALMAALNQARAAMTFADDIADTAKRLHITTDALQEYRYAIRAAGGEAKGADAAIEAFSVNLGKAEQGLTKAQRPFKALGFTEAQIKGFKNADEALRAVVERIAELPEAQRDAAIQQFGLEGLKPLIDAGVQSMDDLRAKAHDAGNVMDAELVKRGAEANDQFEELAQKVDVQLKSALVGLTPILLDLLRIAGDFATTLASIADHMRNVEDRSTKTLQNQLATLKERVNDTTGNAIADVVGLRAQGTTERKIRGRIAGIELILADRAAEAAKPAPTVRPPTRTLIDTSSNGGGRKVRTSRAAKPPEDRSAEAIASVAREELEAHRQLLAEMLGQADLLTDQTSLIRQIADLRETEIKAEQKAADNRADKDAADKRITLAAAATIKEKNAQVAADRLETLRQQTLAQLEERRLAVVRQRLANEERMRELHSQVAAIEEGQATTAGERREIALRNLALDQRIAAAKELQAIQEEMLAGRMSRGQGAARYDAFLAAQEADRGAVEKRDTPGQEGAREAGQIAEGILHVDNMGERYAAMYAEIDRLRTQDRISEEQATRAKAQIGAQYIGERLQGWSDMFGTLAQLSSSGNKKIAAIGKAAGMAQAIISTAVGITKAMELPFPLNWAQAAAVGATGAVQVATIAGVGFERGGYTGDGGRSQVAGLVHGREFVVNAQATQKNRGLLEAMNAGMDAGRIGNTLRAAQAPIGSSMSVSVNPNLHMTIDLRGANGEATIKRIAEEAARAAGVAAYKMAMDHVPARMDRYRKLEMRRY
jgi:hypothetical protein